MTFKRHRCHRSAMELDVAQCSKWLVLFSVQIYWYSPQACLLSILVFCTSARVGFVYWDCDIMAGNVHLLHEIQQHTPLYQMSKPTQIQGEHVNHRLCMAAYSCSDLCTALSGNPKSTQALNTVFKDPTYSTRQRLCEGKVWPGKRERERVMEFCIKWPHPYNDQMIWDELDLTVKAKQSPNDQHL